MKLRSYSGWWFFSIIIFFVNHVTLSFQPLSNYYTAAKYFTANIKYRMSADNESSSGGEVNEFGFPDVPPAWEFIPPSDDYNVEENFPLPDEYKSIDLSRETAIIEILQSESASREDKLGALKELETNPGRYAPGCILQLAFYYIEAHQDLKQGAKWLARAYFRTAVDVKMSQDLSIRELPTNFMAQAGESINATSGLKWEDFQNILLTEEIAKIEEWDRVTPREYDRRWVSTHSVNTITGVPMNYKPESMLQEVLEEEYERYRNWVKNPKSSRRDKESNQKTNNT